MLFCKRIRLSARWNLAATLLLAGWVTVISGSASHAAPYKVVSGDGRYVVYTPDVWDLAADTYYGVPQDYPVLVYLHGANHRDERAYESILRDLADAGNYVIFPRFDAADGATNHYYLRALIETMMALSDVNGLLSRSAIRNVVDPIDVNRVGLAGHSVGGMFALKLANDLPVLGTTPATIVLHDPAGFPNAIPFGNVNWLGAGWDGLGRIPGNPRLAIIVAWDTLVNEYSAPALLGNGPASGIWSRAWHYTPMSRSRKHAFIGGKTHQSASSDYASYGSTYRVITVNALRSAFHNEPFDATPNLIWTTHFDQVTP